MFFHKPKTALIKAGDVSVSIGFEVKLDVMKPSAALNLERLGK